MRNIELKARLADLASARETASRIATERLGTQHQIDTYFCAPHGRLKLRQIDGLSAHIISYARPDESGPKASDYILVPSASPELLKEALSAALGVLCVVDKRREIYLWHNVRIHLDEVTGLGTFLEFEAVLGPNVDDEAGRSQLAELTDQFSIAPSDLLAGSYADMIG